ncbi:hypothetical protein HS088_TW08G00006 [Tripterygium wilfordii]|uniref:HMA domain-containing protein n=1 Tax=Tripterygium wilfordii TaxID=458696 RepID=A0A7J7DAM2_TRIWF|nr:heavy metal-associated isoprenylated plant protein 28 [Tripterygium wilfordii]KAF5743425.1 hypothetical protein HS088_TW08G00006 [Tripterygium wilfordii]
MADLQIVPTTDDNYKKEKEVVEAQYVEMMVPLYSYGCEKKLKNHLSRLKGIYSVNVDYSQQKVTVWGICNKYDVLATARTKRKQARFWNPQHHHHHNNNNEDAEISQPKCKYSSISSKTSLTRARSFTWDWKAIKKVFTISPSF